MLKKINTSHLIIGMFIHELCGSWLDHPFWRTGFLLNNPEDLQQLSQSVKECWIDTSKGLDVQEVTHTLEQNERQAQMSEQTFLQANEQDRNKPERYSITQEYIRTQKIIERSGLAVRQLYTQAVSQKTLNERLTRHVIKDITQCAQRNSSALVLLARTKGVDNYTYMHSVSVCSLMIILAHQLGYSPDQIEDAALAGLLHDIGKMTIPKEILNKPDRLTDAEFAVVKKHPESGAQLLYDSKFTNTNALDVCLHHHEKIDGTGYPHALAPDNIAELTRMGAICDVYDAITSDRPYKKGWEPQESLRKMNDWKGHFDPRLLQAFIKSLGIYPVGTFVLLSNEHCAVVMDQNESLLHPVVRVFYSQKSSERLLPTTIDLSAPRHKHLKILQTLPASNFPFIDVPSLLSH